MEESQTSVVPDDQTPVIVLKKEDDCEVTVDQPETSAESADPSASGCESTTRAESEKQLRVFVALLTVRVLDKCHALKKRNQEEWVTHTKRLVDQTMEGLAVSEDFCPDTKYVKKVCKVVLKDLQKKFGGRRLLESLILSQDPAVDAVIVRSLKTHIVDLPDWLARKASRSLARWTEVLQSIGGALGLLGLLLLPLFLL